MVKLSIIIPYFETYNLTKKIMDELSIQKTNEIEIILIDDGCYEKRFDLYASENIKVIHQENMGVAKTRNKGIELATGKYVGFIDCDDMITMDYIDTLLDAIEKYGDDIINFNWYDLTQHIEVRKPDNYAPWKAIYKKETMPTFREDIEYGGEDVYFQGDIQNGLDTRKYTITYLDKILYIYNSNRIGSLFWKKTHGE